ncbi:FAD-dependent oxidoreductase [Amycolatopsis sp. NPDC059657]|uniref:FAD-dependent oxidoreductase n=1 Tax=Amycolatopsis sp. NPDC059657 TaxID=3346899 RepID=UPI00366B6B53
MTTLEVLVVGAGPVGLTAAHELARQGLRVRLVDAAAGPATTSRALATHARTLETYDQMGVLDELLPRGQRVEHFTLHQNGRRLVRFDTDYSRLPTRFPFTLMVDQVITEEVLRTAVARHGVEVEWGVRLTAFTDHGDRVAVTLEHADGRVEELETGWLAGCDGGHSTVRKQLGLKLLGESSETWLIADALVDCDLPRDSIHWMRTPAGTIMLVPFPDERKWRLLDTAEVSHAGDPAAVARRFAEKISAGTGLPAEVSSPSWVSVFTIQQRMIERMRVGRCLLAGDAAHVHSPASGQGMNTGVQDAVNLSWKLAAVVRGEAGDELLDSYSAERVPVGANLLKSTRMATMLVQLKSRKAAAALRTMFTIVKSLPPLKSRIERKIMGGMSALDLSYESGVGTRAGRVTAARLAESSGWRDLVLELQRPEWTLVTFGAPETHAGVRVLSTSDELLRADLGLEPGGWMLIRPDGYVSAVSGSGSVRDALAAAGVREVTEHGVPQAR